MSELHLTPEEKELIIHYRATDESRREAVRDALHVDMKKIPGNIVEFEKGERRNGTSKH